MVRELKKGGSKKIEALMPKLAFHNWQLDKY